MMRLLLLNVFVGQSRCLFIRFCKVEIGVAVIAIATWQRIGKTNRTLIMTMHMYKLNHMPAE